MATKRSRREAGERVQNWKGKTSINKRCSLSTKVRRTENVEQKRQSYSYVQWFKDHAVHAERDFWTKDFVKLITPEEEVEQKRNINFSVQVIL